MPQTTEKSPLPSRLRKRHSGHVDEAAAECIEDLEGYVEHLEKRIEAMNAMLGKVRMTCRISKKLYAEIDEVMTKEYRR